VADHWGDQAFLDRHRHAHVDFVPVPDVVILPPGIAGGVLPQRHSHGLEDNVVERDPDFLPLCPAAPLSHRLKRLSRFPGPFHVHLGREIERRYRADRLDQALGDSLPDLGQGDVAVGRGRRR
jgi:hypothetical protein